MAAENSHEANPPASLLSTLERTTHVPTILLLLAFLLVVDLAASVSYQSTAFSVSWSFAKEHLSMGHVLLFLVAFGLFMSVGVGVSKYVADYLAFEVVQPLWLKAFPSKETWQPPYRGAVRLWTLREEAHMEQNDFYLGLYEQYEGARRENAEQDRRLASSAFACLVLLAVNYWVLPRYGYPSVSVQLATSFPEAWEAMSALLSFLLLALWLFPILQTSRMDEWGYCLPLYKKIEDEKAKAREKDRLPPF